MIVNHKETRRLEEKSRVARLKQDFYESLWNLDFEEIELRVAAYYAEDNRQSNASEDRRRE